MIEIAVILGPNCKKLQYNWAFVVLLKNCRDQSVIFFCFSCMHTKLSSLDNASAIRHQLSNEIKSKQKQPQDLLICNMKLINLNTKSRTTDMQIWTVQATSCKAYETFLQQEETFDSQLKLWELQQPCVANKNFNKEQDSTSKFILDLKNSLPRYYVRERQNKEKKLRFQVHSKLYSSQGLLLQFCFQRIHQIQTPKFDQDLFNQISKA